MNNNQNDLPLLEAGRSSLEDANVHISESTYYTQMLQEEELKSADLMSVNSTLPEAKPEPGETKFQKFKKVLTKVRQATFGNRRLKSYLLTIAKFFSITFTQANNLFELDKSTTDMALTKSIEIIAYVFMALLILSFTERYIREVYCARKNKSLNIVINWIEAAIFFLYLAFSTITVIIHLVFIGRAATNDTKKYDATKIGLSVFAVLINYYIIIERAWIYLKASKHSVSLYLAKGVAVPNPNSKHKKK